MLHAVAGARDPGRLAVRHVRHLLPNTYLRDGQRCFSTRPGCGTRGSTEWRRKVPRRAPEQLTGSLVVIPAIRIGARASRDPPTIKTPARHAQSGDASQVSTPLANWQRGAKTVWFIDAVVELGSPGCPRPSSPPCPPAPARRPSDPARARCRPSSTVASSPCRAPACAAEACGAPS